MKTYKKIHPFIGLFCAAILVFSCSSGEKKNIFQGSGKIEVVVDPGIDAGAVKIQWVSPERMTVPVFENGKEVKSSIPAAPKDLFEFFIGEKAIGSAGITRSRNKNKHDFSFRIYLKEGERDPFISMHVTGPDSTQGYFVKRYVRDLLDEISREEYYDFNGLKAYETFSNYGREGELLNTNKYEYTYDVWGNRASQEHYSWSPDGQLIHRARNTFRHDEKGNMLEMTFTSFDPGGQIKSDNTNRYTYNEQGLVHEREFLSYDPNGKLLNHFITEYLYNAQGYGTHEILYDANRVKMNMVERTLNPEGGIIKEVITEYNADGSTKSQHGREYDSKGKVLRDF